MKIKTEYCKFTNNDVHIKLLICVFSFFCCSAFTIDLHCQNKSDLLFSSEKKTENIHLIAIGKSNIYDTYLSPLEYKGLNFSYLHKHNKQLALFQKEFIRQQNISIELSRTNSPMKNVSSTFIKLKYEIGGFFSLFKSRKVYLGGGGLTSSYIGGLYNSRNGNNPATARLAIDILPSLIAKYKANQKIQIDFQVNTNLIGCYFQLPYGESYYEFSKGNAKKSINFSSPLNIRLLDILVYNKIKINHKNLLVGVKLYAQQTKIHSINTHNYNYDFLLGFSF